MALFDMRYRSAALGKDVSLIVVIPEVAKAEQALKDGTVKTLYLLHGLSGDNKSWMCKTAIERYATARRIAVVMPNADRSWYTDTAYGMKYFTFITQELPEIMHLYFRVLSKRPEDTYIGGLSMGGYGALKAALTYPEKYAGCFSLSGGLDIWSERRWKAYDEWRSIFGFDLQNPADLAGTDHDVFALARKRKAEGVTLPEIYMWCGESDGESLLGANRKLHEEMEQLGVKHQYDESEGNHSWKWWDLHVQDALNYLMGYLE